MRHGHRAGERAANRFFYGWVVAAGCLLITMANGGLFWTFAVFFRPLSLEFGWSRGELSLVNTTFLLAYAPGAIIWGRIADRFGPRHVLWLASLLVLLGYLGSSRIESRTPLILYYALIGLGTSATLGLPVATVQRWFIKQRGLMLGIVASGTGVGSLIFAPLANRLIYTYQWRTAYVVLGIVLSLWLALGAYLMAHSPEKKGLRPDGEEKPPPTGVSPVAPGEVGIRAGQALRTKAFWGLASLHILSFMPNLFFTTHFVTYAIDRGMTAFAAAQALGLMSACGIPGRILLGKAADRIGWMRGVAVANFVAAAATLSLPLSNQMWILYLFVVVFGFFNWGVLSLLSGAVSLFFGTVSLGEILGYALAISVVTGSVSPLLGGLIFDWTGSYLLFFLFGVACFVGGGIYALVLKPPSRKGGVV